MVFKKRKPTFLSREAEQYFNDQFQRILCDVVKVGKVLTLEPWERDQCVDTFEKLHVLPKNQQESALNKVRKIPVFRTGNITERFTNTLDQKLINLLRADLLGKPLRLSRDKEQWYGAGRFAKSGMDYDEFFGIDDILCILGIAKQHVPVDGWKEEQNLETRIWLTDHGKSLLADCHKDIVNYLECNNNFKEVILNKSIEIKVKDKETGKMKKKKVSVPVPYDNKIDHVSRTIGRVKRFNRIYEEHRLTVRCSDIELAVKEINKLLIHHIDGKIQIRRLVYSLPNSTYNIPLLNTNIIEVINNTSYVSGNKREAIQLEGDSKWLNRPGAGIKGRSIVLCQYNNDMHCQADNENITINNIEFEILDKRIHRVFSREN